jgi:hypothetical protein
MAARFEAVSRFLALNAPAASSMHWHCLQHVPYESLGSLATWVAERGHTVTLTRLWEDASFPATHDYDGLFILGGPMNVYEESKFSWLSTEKKFIDRAVKERKPILGICLGGAIAVSGDGRIRYKGSQQRDWLVPGSPHASRARMHAVSRFP